MKSPEHVRKALRMWGRKHRSIAADLEEMRDSVRALVLDRTIDSDVKARYRAALNLWDTLIVESRAIADQADELLRHKEVPPTEFASLHRRVRLLSAQTNAVTAEACDAAVDHTLKLKPPSKT